ncbi:MAG: hypothetical protein NC080_11445 [Paraprevotella sp.]|nr:hypothetical protein [Paraprevotella sp.]
MTKTVFLTSISVCLAGCALLYASFLRTESNSSVLLANVEALSQEGDATSNLWTRVDKDCTYTFTARANAEIKVKIAGANIITLRADASGNAQYTIKDGKTHCSANGNEQCEARYCQQLSAL